jgi:hypothetical protein
MTERVNGSLGSKCVSRSLWKQDNNVFGEWCRCAVKSVKSSPSVASQVLL